MSYSDPQGQQNLGTKKKKIGENYWNIIGYSNIHWQMVGNSEIFVQPTTRINSQ